MQGYNLIAVLSPDGERMLMCRRSKDPYQGLLNLVGGKIEPGESEKGAAYRELDVYKRQILRILTGWSIKTTRK